MGSALLVTKPNEQLAGTMLKLFTKDAIVYNSIFGPKDFKLGLMN